MHVVVLLKHRVFLSLSRGAKSIQGLAPRLYALVSVFVCTDKACSWESRESWEPHLLRFQLFETGVLGEGSQILHAAPPGVKARSPALAFLLALEIGNDQAPPWFEHTGDFRESLTFEALRQMMHHQGREHHIERLIGEGELLDYPNLEIDGHFAPSSFRAGTGDLLVPGSMPATRPALPTRRWTSIASVPVPQPTSSTASPG